MYCCVCSTSRRCPGCGVATEEELELPDTGAVESFTIVHIPIPGNPIVPPYVCAMIRLDGADISFFAFNTRS